MRMSPIARTAVAAFVLSMTVHAKAADGPDGGLATGEQKLAPVSADPQQTSATFGDWVVRCAKTEATRTCEVAQALVIKGQQAPIAQIAFGHRPNEAKAPLVLTILLPVSISFGKPAGLTAGTDKATELITAYRRCLPGGCLADVSVEPAVLKELGGSLKQGKLTFVDAADRSIALPISYRGFAQAIDDLAKETVKDAASR